MRGPEIFGTVELVQYSAQGRSYVILEDQEIAQISIPANAVYGLHWRFAKGDLDFAECDICVSYEGTHGERKTKSFAGRTALQDCLAFLHGSKQS